MILNADYQPLSYFPLSVCSWKDAIKAFFLGRVDVVANYGEVVHSPSVSMHIPSVIVLKDYVSPTSKPPFSRFNLYLRDAFVCQYCGDEGYIPGYREGISLTLDHVHPKSRGGHLTWQNTVAACSLCNVKKANRTPEEAGMPLRIYPRQPTQRELLAIARTFPQHAMHETWMEFLRLDNEEK